MKKGQVVICVQSSFAEVELTENQSIAENPEFGAPIAQQPKLWEALKIGDIQGDCLIFSKYNTPEKTMLWQATAFKTPSQALAMLSNYIYAQVELARNEA